MILFYFVDVVETSPGAVFTTPNFLHNKVTRLGNFWELFVKDEVAQRNGNVLGFFLLQQFFLHFT
jgi:hypothetical protein